MRATIMQDARDVQRSLANARPTLMREWKRGAFKVGADSVKLARDNFRTEVRSAQRVRSYGHAVSSGGSGVTLDIGPIRPGVGGKVPIHARVLEGFNAAGQSVSKFIIKAKNGGYLHFPIRKGPGLSKSNIVGWARVKQVELTPDPSFPRVERFATPALEQMGGRVFKQVMGGGGES